MLVLAALTGWWLSRDRPGGGWLRPTVEAPAPRGYPKPPPPAGTDLLVELVEAPAETYAAPAPTAADKALAPLVREAGAQYDPALGHAARELAAWYAADGRLAPSAALAFLLDSAGAVAWGMRQGVLVTTEEDDEAVIRAVRSHIEEGRRWVGVGEAWQLGEAPRRVIAVVATGVAPRIAPFPRSAEVGDEAVLSGNLPIGYGEPSALVMRPDLGIDPLEVRVAGRGFEIPVGFDEAGTWVVELLAQGPRGPIPMAQLTTWVGEPVPDRYEGVWPPDESGVELESDGVEELAAFFAQERERYGLEPLERDPELDRVAQAHSEEMADKGFVGHLSPTTGDAGDRVAGARYRAVAVAENVALNQSLWDAHAGLLRSLGHRRNILSRSLTHVGFGAARRDESWYVTQLFATPRPVVGDPEVARRHLLARLRAARGDADDRRLRLDRRLAEVAQAEAESRAPAPRRALDRAHVAARATAWVAALPTLDTFTPRGELTDPDWRRVGVGVHQRDDLEGPDIQVVVLMAE